MVNNCLIMAGGSGTRLWPASHSRKPKQFLPAATGTTETFFSMSLRRALGVITDSGQVIVIAGKSHMPLVIEACSTLSAAEKERLVLIPEPEAKNTAPAIACAVAYAQKTTGQDSTMLVLPSDHIIKPVEVFKQDVAIAASFAAQEQLVIFGISPSRPETGYGYIETGEKRAGNVYAVTAFQEKPDRATAETYINVQRFFWNSGMFAFSCDFIAGEFRRLAAAVSDPFEQLTAPHPQSYATTNGLRVLSNWTGLDTAYRHTKNISFDYAVTVQCARTVMVRAAFDWIDIGCWDEYARLLSDTGIDPADSIVTTELYTAGSCEGCFVDSDIPVALAGAEDLIIVIRSGKDGSPPVALIARKGETQKVRDIVDQIKRSGKTAIL